MFIAALYCAIDPNYSAIPHIWSDLRVRCCVLECMLVRGSVHTGDKSEARINA
jgi:hypothetical protein